MKARAYAWAIAAVWVWQTAFALLVAWPAASLVRAGAGLGADGDAPLWDAGAHALLAFLASEAHGVSALLNTASGVLILGATLGLVPSAGLLVVLAHPTPPIFGVRRGVAALRALPSLAALFVLITTAQGAVAFLALLLGKLAETWTHDAVGESYSQRIAAGVVLFALPGIVALGVLQDLARAAVVRFRVGARRALHVAARSLKQAPGRWSWAWAWRVGAGLAAILGASAVATRLGGGGGVALVCLAAVHQAAIVVRIGLRASWLAVALGELT